MFSPLTIGLMLHAYAICEPFPDDKDAPAVKRSLAQLCELGLLREASGIHVCGFEATLKGQAWVEMLCATPPPKTVFQDPRTGETIKDRFSS